MNRAEIILGNLEYSYLDGPVSLEELQVRPVKGNCRLAVQQYFYETHGIYLSGRDIVLPDAYEGRGKIVKNSQNGPDNFFNGLQKGDIVHAEKLRDSCGRKFRPDSKKFETEYERLVHLHLAIYLGLPTDEILSRFSFNKIDPKKPVIWHSTFIAKGTDVWSLEEFYYYYKPEIAMRITF